MPHKMSQQRGFAALFSVLVLSAILLAMIAAADDAAFVAHEAVADEHSYREAQEAALSCARFAFSRLDADPLRFLEAGTTTIQLLDSTCSIVAASSTESNASALTGGMSGASSVFFFSTAARASSTTPFTMDAWTEY